MTVNEDIAARLLERGRTAFLDGDTRRAHDLWRKAAMYQPYDEKIWLALLRVVENDADRRVCLENILRINPENDLATSQLAALTDETPPPTPKRRRLARFVRLLWIVQFFMVGLLIGALILVLLHVL